MFFYLKLINVQKFKFKILRITQLKIKLKAFFQLICLFIILMFITHMFALGFFYVSALVTKYDYEQLTWLTGLDISPDLIDAPFYIKYERALYWTVTSMSSSTRFH